MLTIGVDFDNTLVDYNRAFYRLALEKKLIQNDFPQNKLIIRDYLRKIDKEDEWTVMQGEIYGSRMDEALLYTGAIEFITHMQDLGHQLFIISHKTQHPIIGKRYDLHKAAFDFAKKNIPISTNHIYFELTKKEKINRIIKSGCDVFIDDLPEILEDAAFPSTIKKILFDCDHHQKNVSPAIVVCASWNEVSSCLQP